MKWYLIFSLYNTDDLLLKEMESREQCQATLKEFIKEAGSRIDTIKDITCEEGIIVKQYTNGEQDEVL